MALEDILIREVELVYSVRHFADWNQSAALNSADFVFVWFSDIDEIDMCSSVHCTFELGDSDLLFLAYSVHASASESAESFVVDQCFDGRVLSAYWAVWIFLKSKLSEIHLQRIEEQQPPDKRLSLSQNYLDRLGSLQSANHAWK